MANRFNWIASSLFLFLGAMSLQTTCFAQASSQSKPKAAQTIAEKTSLRLLTEKVKTELREVTFQEAVATLSRLCHVSFMADDVPSDERFSIRYEGEIGPLLDKFASFYDYSWKVSRGGSVIQMMKQYSAIHDYPQAHMKEMLQVSKEMQSVLRSLGAFVGQDYSALQTAKNLYRSFTPEQFKLFSTGYEMPASELQATQMDLLKQYASRHFLSEEAELWNLFSFRLTNLTHANFEILEQNGGAFKYFMLNFSPGAKLEQNVFIRDITSELKAGGK